MPKVSVTTRDSKAPLYLFLCAFAVRAAAGFAIFGSIDLINTLTNAERCLHSGNFFYQIPSFPILPVFFRVGAGLNIATNLPLAFCFKLAPILFDASIPVLIFLARSQERGEQAWAAALCYALCPVSLIITCLHAQWDAICLFFLVAAFLVRTRLQEGTNREVLFGALFIASILVKPFPAMLLPALLPPLAMCRTWGWRLYVRKCAWTCAGALAVGGTALLVFAGVGYDLGHLCTGIFAYSNRGVQIFGLPFAPGINELGILNHRLWLLFAVAGISALYHDGRISSFRFVAAAFLMVLGLSGLGPQYLLWPLPFLLVSERLAVPAVFGFLSGVFLILYYLCPTASYIPGENLGTFVPLNSLFWLLPPTTWFDTRLLPLVQALGNLVLPLACLGLLYLTLRRRNDRAACLTVHPSRSNSIRNLLRETQPLAPALLLMLITVPALTRVLLTNGVISMYHLAVFSKLPSYAFYLAPGGKLIFEGAPRPGTWFSLCNVASIALAGTFAWFLLALKLDLHTSRSPIAASTQEQHPTQDCQPQPLDVQDGGKSHDLAGSPNCQGATQPEQECLLKAKASQGYGQEHPDIEHGCEPGGLQERQPKTSRP